MPFSLKMSKKVKSMHELPESDYGNNQKGTLFSGLHIFHDCI